MWTTIIGWAVSTVLSALLAPKPKLKDAQPAQIGDKDIPMASADAPIPVVFGTRVVSQPNVVWWGDVRADAIRKCDGGKK